MRPPLRVVSFVFNSPDRRGGGFAARPPSPQAFPKLFTLVFASYGRLEVRKLFLHVCLIKHFLPAARKASPILSHDALLSLASLFF